MPETETAHHPKLHAFCYFQGTTPEEVAKDLKEYGPGESRLFLLTDDADLAHYIRHTQEQGAKFYIQVKAERGGGGDPNNNSHPCPGSPSC